MPYEDFFHEAAYKGIVVALLCKSCQDIFHGAIYRGIVKALLCKHYKTLPCEVA